MMPGVATAVVWGDVATWFAGLMSGAAVVISTLAFRVSAKATAAAAESAGQSAELVRIERKRFELEEAARHRQQASQVNARLVWRQKSEAGLRLVEHQYLVVANHSNDRVTDVVLQIDCPEPDDIPRPLGWSSKDVDVVTVPMVVTLEDLQPSSLTGLAEFHIEVDPTPPTLDQANLPLSVIRLSWVPRPAPYAVPPPLGLDNPAATRSDALDLFRDYDRIPRPLSEPRLPAGPALDRARYEHVVALLNRGRGRTGSRATGGATRWVIEFTDSRGVRWRRTPKGLVDIADPE